MTDFAHKLPAFSVVSVKKRLRGFAGWAGTILRDVVFRATIHRFDGLAILPGVIAVKILPIPILTMIDDLGELIHLELLIFWRMGIVEGPLLKRNISADKGYQPAVLLIKTVA